MARTLGIVRIDGAGALIGGAHVVPRGREARPPPPRSGRGPRHGESASRPRGLRLRRRSGPCGSRSRRPGSRRFSDRSPGRAAPAARASDRPGRPPRSAHRRPGAAVGIEAAFGPANKTRSHRSSGARRPPAEPSTRSARARWAALIGPRRASASAAAALVRVSVEWAISARLSQSSTRRDPGREGLETGAFGQSRLARRGGWPAGG